MREPIHPPRMMMEDRIRREPDCGRDPHARSRLANGLHSMRRGTLSARGDNMHSRLGWLVAVSCVAVTASASPGPHITVLDFEGPHRLADAAQHLVLTTLAANYDIIPAKRWEAASSSSSDPVRWSQAAKAAGVDAVIEGWIDPDGLPHTMTVSVRDASNGRQIDTIAVEISEQGVVSAEQTRNSRTSSTTPSAGSTPRRNPSRSASNVRIRPANP
ncbi:MAG TPA: hypothetical protein VH143_31695 [Kofleriaceae bacterium]|nr:hypothetical protein [Kofleriaceae bacterium]